MLELSKSGLQLTPNPLLAPPSPLPAAAVGHVEREMNERPHIAGDRRQLQRHKADVQDSRQAKSAVEALGDLPGPKHALHILITGRFSLWDCVPAVIETCGRIRSLHIATLGFSKRNVEAMGKLLDGGQIERLRLLCSHYFKGTSNGIYEFAAEELGRRPGAEFLSVRTHAKLLLIKLTNRTLAFESSANLRSCKNLEQLTVIGCPEVYQFHAAWIDELFERGATFVNERESGGTSARTGTGQNQPGSEVGAERRDRARHPRSRGAPLAAV